MHPSEIILEVLYGVSSPWAFLGAPEAERIAKRFGVELRMRPILVIEGQSRATVDARARSRWTMEG